MRTRGETDAYEPRRETAEGINTASTSVFRLRDCRKSKRYRLSQSVALRYTVPPASQRGARAELREREAMCARNPRPAPVSTLLGRLLPSAGLASLTSGH